MMKGFTNVNVSCISRRHVCAGTNCRRSDNWLRHWICSFEFISARLGLVCSNYQYVSVHNDHKSRAKRSPQSRHSIQPLPHLRPKSRSFQYMPWRLLVSTPCQLCHNRKANRFNNSRDTFLLGSCTLRSPCLLHHRSQFLRRHWFRHSSRHTSNRDQDTIWRRLPRRRRYLHSRPNLVELRYRQRRPRSDARRRGWCPSRHRYAW